MRRWAGSGNLDQSPFAKGLTLPPEIAQLPPSMTIDRFALLFAGAVILAWLIQMIVDYTHKRRSRH